MIGVTLCQGAAPSGSSKEIRVTGQSEETFHNEGKVNLTLEKVISNLTPKEKDGVPPLLPVAGLKGEMLSEISRNEDERKRSEGELDMKHSCKELGKDSSLESSTARSWANDNSSPLAMTFNQEKGWVTEPLGPTSGHWKRLARKVTTPSPNKVECTSKTKRKGLVPL